MNNFEVIIGIEIHIELNTKTKMFSSAPNDFNLAPNTAASVVDLAYPGTLPQLNKEAVVKAIRFAKALNMKIDHELHFDRKNYFYPDLPKGFQITQNERPIARGGFIPTASKEIKIEKFHLEEDTAKSLHEGANTLLNYNRAGTPLIEIVTEPVIYSSQQAVDYISAIRELAIALDISDAKMEEGSLRADINISLRPYGQKQFGTKVEIKNLNSLGNVKKSIDDEIAKQSKALLKGELILQATKRFDETKQETVIMRVKTGAADYKFFPENNIVPIALDPKWVESIEISELPWEQKVRYIKAGLDAEYVQKLMADLPRARYFDSIEFDDKVQLAKIFFAELVQIANAKNTKVEQLEINPRELTKALKYLSNGDISGKHIKELIPLLVGGKASTDEIIELRKMKQISDEDELSAIIDKIVKENKQFIADNAERPERVSKFVLGQLMKDTGGQANPIVSAKLVNSKMNR